MLSTGAPVPNHLRTEYSAATNLNISEHLGYLTGLPSGPALWTLPPTTDLVNGAPLYIRNESIFPIVLQSLDGSISGPSVVPALSLLNVLLADGLWRSSLVGVTALPPPPPYHLVLTTQTFVATATPTTVASVPWAQTTTAYTAGLLTVACVVSNRGLTVTLRTSQDVLLASLLVGSSGTYEIPLTVLPTLPCSVILQIATTAGGTAPQLTSALLQYS